MRSHNLKTNQSDRPLIRRAPKEFPNNHLKVCGISHADVYSQSFNGLGIASKLLKEGIEYSLLSDIHLRGFGKSLTPKKLQGTKKLIVKLERISGYQSRLFFWTRFLKFKREFKNADLIHYHILHNEYFRLEALKYLTRKKTSIWTLHDLWLSTGHCIQPLECKRFGNGCGSCPDLSRTLAVRRDRTKSELLRKRKLVNQINCDFIVSTNWMKIRTLSTLPIHPKRLHVIPFGVDTDFFKPLSEVQRSELRRKESLLTEHTYIFVNAHDDYIKGIDIVESLVSTALPLSQLRFVLIDDSQKWKYFPNVISIPRANSPEEIRRLIQLSDLVVIPSRGESFSLIALESMSCGKPVITLRNSAPHEVTQSKDEYTFTLRDSAGQIISIIGLFSNSLNRLAMEGERNRDRALDNFSMEIHVAKMAEVYRTILRGKKNA
jgi:glycosyltransferase involved in cell wall biosynthesis